MIENTTYLKEFDRKVVKNLNDYGRSIKKYELINLLKRDFACSELEISQSLDRLIENKIIIKNKKNEYLVSDYRTS